MAYRGDETDPLEIIIAQRRFMRRMLMGALLAMVLPWWVHPGNLLLWLLRPYAHAAVAVAPPPRMTAAQVEDRLRLSPAVIGAPREARCHSGHDGWDYFCTYRPDPTSMLFQIGVHVGPTEIVQTSIPYAYGRVIPPPPP